MMIKKQIHQLLLSLCLLWVLTGCLSVPGVVETPKISVQDVALQNISLQQGTALIRLNVSNPNAFPLPLRGVQYGLRVNGRQVASGQHAQQRNINARESMAIDIPVQMNLMEMVSLIPSIMQQRQLQYELNGQVDLPFIGIPFSKRGGAGI